MPEYNDNEKLDILIDQVGRFTEGLTELKAMVHEQLIVAQTQAESISRQVAVSERLAATTERQAQTVERQSQLIELLIEQQRKPLSS